MFNTIHNFIKFEVKITNFLSLYSSSLEGSLYNWMPPMMFCPINSSHLEGKNMFTADSIDIMNVIFIFLKWFS